MRVGSGYDIHPLVEGRPLLLGGVEIPYRKGAEAHSDGDVLIHALIDALLGAAAAGDIGTHFPSGDPLWKGASGKSLLRKTTQLLKTHSYRIVNVDTTVVLQEPQISSFIGPIRTSLSRFLEIPIEDISVKGKSKEKLDAVGEGQAIEAFASVLIETHRK